MGAEAHGFSGRSRSGVPITEEQYLSERIEDQIRWYSRKSSWNQSWYKLLRRAELLLSASIPVVVGLGPDSMWTRLIVALTGAALAFISGVHGLYAFQEHWIEYRATSEALKQEKFLYLTRAGAYAETQEPFRLLVERAEGLISHENLSWLQLQRASGQTSPMAARRQSAGAGSGSSTGS